MKRRKWTSQHKLQIVLEGAKGSVPPAEICSRNQISQAQYYQWCDRLLRDGAKVFDYGGPKKEEERLRRENSRLKELIGDLTVEVKNGRRSYHGI